MANRRPINFGKIVRILGVPLEDDLDIVYGLDTPHYQLDFAHICMPLGGNMYFKAEPHISKTSDGRKEIYLFGSECRTLEQKDIEDTLLVIIPYANQLCTSAEKIAGRYPTEAVLLLHAGDTVELSKSAKGKRTVYMAVQAGNELFLVKKNR